MSKNLSVAPTSKINLPINITVPPNTSSFYKTGITIPVSWYTVATGRNYAIYFRLISPADSPDSIDSKCTLPEGIYTTFTCCSAFCDVMNAHYAFAPPPYTCPTRFAQRANLVNDTINISNANNIFKQVTDAQT